MKGKMFLAVGLVALLAFGYLALTSRAYGFQVGNSAGTRYDNVVRGEPQPSDNKGDDKGRDVGRRNDDKGIDGNEKVGRRPDDKKGKNVDDTLIARRGQPEIGDHRGRCADVIPDDQKCTARQPEVGDDHRGKA